MSITEGNKAAAQRTIVVMIASGFSVHKHILLIKGKSVYDLVVLSHWQFVPKGERSGA